MNVVSRLKKIERELTKSGNIAVRLVECNGEYPEYEEDYINKRLVIKVMIDGMSCEELREFAK